MMGNKEKPKEVLIMSDVHVGKPMSMQIALAHLKEQFKSLQRALPPSVEEQVEFWVNND